MDLARNESATQSGSDSGDQSDPPCRFSLLSRVRLLTLKDLSVSRPMNFRFIEYSFSFIRFLRTFGAAQNQER
jgi:hypothetical protein